MNVQRHCLSCPNSPFYSSFQILEELCDEQNYRLVEAHKLVDTFRSHLRSNARDLCDSQLRNFHQTVEDLRMKKMIYFF